jgi:hypothetical protein
MSSYSIIAVVTGLLTAILLCPVLFYIYYQAPDDFTPTTQGNATQTGEPGR